MLEQPSFADLDYEHKLRHVPVELHVAAIRLDPANGAYGGWHYIIEIAPALPVD